MQCNVGCWTLQTWAVDPHHHKQKTTTTKEWHLPSHGWETVVDYIFAGKTIACSVCHGERRVDRKMPTETFSFLLTNRTTLCAWLVTVQFVWTTHICFPRLRTRETKGDQGRPRALKSQEKKITRKCRFSSIFGVEGVHFGVDFIHPHIFVQQQHHQTWIIY